MKKNHPELTNIFERALMDRFMGLDLGMPDDKIMEVIERAGAEMTREVKEIMNRDYAIRQERKRELARDIQ
jgi:hypothetical protein